MSVRGVRSIWREAGIVSSGCSGPSGGASGPWAYTASACRGSCSCLAHNAIFSRITRDRDGEKCQAPSSHVTGLLVDRETATLSDPRSILVKDPRKWHHEECQEGQKTRCPVNAELIVHLHPEERKGCYAESTSIRECGRNWRTCKAASCNTIRGQRRGSI